MFKRFALKLVLATAFVSGTAAPSWALDIYEPDSPYATAPNVLIQHLPPGIEAKAKVGAAGAELVSSNPQFANAVVTLDKGGKLRADVYLKIQRVISLPGDDGTKANAIAQALNKAHAAGNLRADKITPGRRNNHYVILAGRDTLLTVDDKVAAQAGTRPAMLTLRWLDNLRTAMGGTPFSTASRGGLGLGGALMGRTMTGHASWYGPGFHGRRAASGERFDQNKMTAAHKTLPFGTVLLVTNTANNRSCLVRINDRGPYVAGRMIDLSAAAARSIGISGVGQVRLDILKE
jgi:rare lipoprotein A